MGQDSVCMVFKASNTLNYIRKYRGALRFSKNLHFCMYVLNINVKCKVCANSKENINSTKSHDNYLWTCGRKQCTTIWKESFYYILRSYVICEVPEL